jgi:hypothetical protein
MFVRGHGGYDTGVRDRGVHPDLCLRALHRVLETGHKGRDREAGRGLLGDLQVRGEGRGVSD